MSMSTTPVLPEDKAEVAVLKTVAARLKEVRELAGIHSYQTANWLGVSAAELTALEDGIHSVPLSTVKKAAEIFDVSIDYLFGQADDWELCIEVRQERDFSVHLQNLFVEEQAKVATKLVEQDSRITALSEAVTELGPAIKNVYEAIFRFWELNPQFDEMKGGASVIYHLDHADKAGHEATCKMVRAGLLPIEMLNNHPIQEPTNQMVDHG